ncbi:MAG: glucose-1-phosphate thymidylyltransferase RfbA [Bacteriovoracaceae bacterium]|nr:glucose-1-phosphate thymidylyltransferase RfbA [Bacteriovoracaceae bacterium]
MKGILLAGGSGTRLYPLTEVTSKQLLPVYDKPMICYPLSTLMLLGIKDVLIISTPRDLPLIEKYLGSGSQYGIKLTYKIQEEPKGIAEAFILGNDFIENSSVCLILGDNVFSFAGSVNEVKPSSNFTGAQIVGYHVPDPERFGVVEKDSYDQVISLEEKPKKPKSQYAAVGLYFYDNSVVKYVKELKPSLRGELEITDLNNRYLSEKKLSCSTMKRGSVWMDAGTPESLATISDYVRTVEQIQGLKIACLEEVALRQGFISQNEFFKLRNNIKEGSSYRSYLDKVLVNGKLT